MTEPYDINFTKNRILGTAIQIVDGIEYFIHEQIGMPEHCPFTDIVHYWGNKMAVEEQPAFFEFFDIERIKKCYEQGERLIAHKYWTNRFYVKDTGICMSREFAEHAFEQFKRDKNIADRIAGSGLGLPIVKHLTNLMGGECHLETALNKGTDISCTIPFRIVEKPLQKKEAHSDIQIEPAGKRGLLVDDHEFNREVMKFLLEKVGIVVDEADDGTVVIKMLNSVAPGRYDFILMDLQMSEMDGYAAAREIRRMSNPKIANIPILAMSANVFQ